MFCPKDDSYVARDSRRKGDAFCRSAHGQHVAREFPPLPIRRSFPVVANRVQTPSANPDVWRRTFMTQRFVAAITASILATVLIGVPVTAQRNSKDGAGLTVPFSTTGTNNGV